MNSGSQTKGPGEADIGAYRDEITFAKEEMERRRRSPVFKGKEEIEAEFKGHHKRVLIFDPRVGSGIRTVRLWVNSFPPGAEEGQMWKTLGHRHTVEAVIHILQGSGHSIIDGTRYDWKTGDFICVPMFSWHRHINSSDQDMVYVACTTGPLSFAIGLAIYEDERFADQWVFAQQGEGALGTLIPGGVQRIPSAAELGDGQAAEFYREELQFAPLEEVRRRQSRVLVKAEDLKFERTIMGRVAHVVHPKLGFLVRVLSTMLLELDQAIPTASHRHQYEETAYVLKGEGRSFIADREYKWAAGDALFVPPFEWHQHLGVGSEPARLLVHTNRPLVENLGLNSTQHDFGPPST